jgi:hypothetical protein
MSPQELEELYIRSLDAPIQKHEQELLVNEVRKDPARAREFEQHNTIREVLKRKTPDTFGPYFSARLIHKIQNSGILVDHQIFSFFKKFQLVAIGVIVALLVANIVFSEEQSLTSIFGLEEPSADDEQIVSFDYSQTLNK